jgi:hypothetical protein
MSLKNVAAVIATAWLIAPVMAQWALAQPALADDATPDTAGGRYIFNKQADGFVRLDTRSGQVALCSQRAVGWACEAAPEDRAMLENEIARLRSENIALKKDILSRGLPLPPGAAPEPPVAENGAPQISVPNLHLPSDADVDRMVALANRVWHRLIDAVERAQKRILDKS